MPHMNRARLVNVAFNNAKAFFEDFRLNFSGKSTAYDLENGGGKSVLLMMLLQTVIPNTSLREDKPLKNIFSGGKDRTSHVLIEWILDEGERYKYMLTGFCARKKRSRTDNQQLDEVLLEQDDDISNEGIDYYNYVIFYNEPVEHDINSLELAQQNRNGKTFKGYDELRSDLKRLTQKNIPAGIFDKKGEYMDFLGSHNLIGTEWKIIREINSGENSIEKYFRENKTSRRLIENLLIPIINDTENGSGRSGKLNDDKNEQLADTLIEIRESLAKLMKDREHLGEYSQIRNFYNRVLNTSKRMEEDFVYKEDLQQEALMIKNLLAKNLEAVINDITYTNANLEEKEKNNKKTINEKQLLEIQLLEFNKNALEAEQSDVKDRQETLTIEADRQDIVLKEAKAIKEYIQYKDTKRKYQVEQKKLETLSVDSDEILKTYKKAGSTYKAVLKKTERDLKGKQEAELSKMRTFEEKDNQIDDNIGKINTEIGSANARAEIKNNEISKAEKGIRELTDYFYSFGRMDIVIDQKSFLKSVSEGKINIEKSLTDTDNALEANKAAFENAKEDITENNQKLSDLNWQAKEPKRFLTEYEDLLESINEKVRIYAAEELGKLKNKINKLLYDNKEQLLQKRIDENAIKRRIQILETHGFYIPNEEVLAFADKLKNKCVFVEPGIKYLSERNPNDRENLLKRISLLPYSVLIDHDSFARLKSGRLNIGSLYNDYPVPVIDVDMLRSEKLLDFKEIVFPSANEKLILSEYALTEYKESLTGDLKKVNEEIYTLEERIDTYDSDLRQVEKLNIQFTYEKVSEQQNKLKELNVKIAEYKVSSSKNEALLREIKSKAEQLKEGKEALIKDLALLKEWQEKAGSLLSLNNAYSEAKREFERIQTALKDLMHRLSELMQNKDSNNSSIKAIADNISSIDKLLWEVNNQLSRVADFEDETFSDKAVRADENYVGAIMPDYTQAGADFDALESKVRGRINEEENIKDNMKNIEITMEKCIANMTDHFGITVEIIEKRELAGETFTEPSPDFIRSIDSKIKGLKKVIDIQQKKHDDLRGKINVLEGQIIAQNRLLDDSVEIITGRFEFRHEIEKALEEAAQIIRLYDDEIMQLKEKLKSLSKKEEDIHRELSAYNDFLLRENIQQNTDAAALEAKSYQLFSNTYYSHSNRIKDWNLYWGREKKSMQRESGGFFIKRPVDDLEQLEIPDSLQTCRLLIGQLEDSITIIDEKMDKIQEDITLLQSYQDEFVRRCIKRADSTLDILKKFPALSRIDIEGKKENMVKMDFYDFDDKEKVTRMENHINRIIQEISENGNVDRIRIANKLSTKDLLAQITNMERAIVRLYKMENIKEHSRYLKWENAVGSEGQSNALYFIFAVCLISYIRLLSANTSSARTKKVIIADNPFGATSAVYLWEPMFSILKANDVQLIAPGHNIPRELTAQFEVNYLLNQDILSDSRIKVVVKDVRTEENLDRMNYEKIEQVSFI